MKKTLTDELNSNLLSEIRKIDICLPKELKHILYEYASFYANKLPPTFHPLKNGDFTRLTGLHSWYKHLGDPSRPTTFTFICAQNPQSNGRDFVVDGMLHWYYQLDGDSWLKDFKDQRILKIVKSFEVKMNRYLYCDFDDDYQMYSVYSEEQKIELKRMGSEMSTACRNVYAHLLNIGYTYETLNQPFQHLLNEPFD